MAKAGSKKAEAGGSSKSSEKASQGGASVGPIAQTTNFFNESVEELKKVL